MALTILLAGGTGFIGRRLVPFLQSKGHTVRVLTRKPEGSDQFGWDPMAGTIDDNAVRGADIAINLAGAGIADRRWTAARKKLIIDSRVQSAHTLRAAFQRLGQLPKAYISSSAMGYYGNSGENWVTESDAPADKGFMVNCCVAWEGAAEEFTALGVRTVLLRTGIVLGKEGGALREIARPLYFGIGGYFADGQAWYSWIHLDDLCRLYLWAIEHPQAEGIFNAVAPHPVRNIDLVKATAKAMGRAAVFIPAPTFALRLAFGEMANTILFSNRVSADKTIQAGFHFQYPELDMALEHIFK